VQRRANRNGWNDRRLKRTNNELNAYLSFMATLDREDQSLTVERGRPGDVTLTDKLHFGVLVCPRPTSALSTLY
jgi:hypothetical protein